MSCRLTRQFSGRTLPNVPWHFIVHGPLQLLVRRLAQRSSRAKVALSNTGPNELNAKPSRFVAHHVLARTLANKLWRKLDRHAGIGG